VIISQVVASLRWIVSYNDRLWLVTTPRCLFLVKVHFLFRFSAIMSRRLPKMSSWLGWDSSWRYWSYPSWWQQCLGNASSDRLNPSIELVTAALMLLKRFYAWMWWVALMRSMKLKRLTQPIKWKVCNSQSWIWIQHWAVRHVSVKLGEKRRSGW
jgi:hypothetical protein